MVKTKSLKRIFRKWQKEHPNFVTPDIITLHQTKDYIIELSEGDFMRKDVYGVSLFKYKGKGSFKGIHNIGATFPNIKDAKAYIEDILEDI